MSASGASICLTAWPTIAWSSTNRTLTVSVAGGAEFGAWLMAELPVCRRRLGGPQGANGGGGIFLKVEESIEAGKHENVPHGRLQARNHQPLLPGSKIGRQANQGGHRHARHEVHDRQVQHDRPARVLLGGGHHITA